MLVQNISMKYLQDLGTASVPYLFRGLIYVGIQYDHKRDRCWQVRRGLEVPCHARDPKMSIL